MAFDLTARIRIMDGLTAPLRRATDQVRKTNKILEGMNGTLTKSAGAQGLMTKSTSEMVRSFSRVDSAADIGSRSLTTYRDSAGRLRDEFGRFGSSGKHASGAFDGISGSAKRAQGSVLSLKSALGGVMGLAAGYGMYRGAESFLTSALGGAAQYELATVQIEALFQDAQKAKTYMERMSASAALSPILNEQQVFDNSKSFLALTKDQNVLEDMWKVAEQLSAMDPMQGLAGSVLAMRELAGGDSQSLVERFELPRSVVNQWKNLPIAQQAKAMDKYLDSLGFNQKYLEKVGVTSAKQFDRTQELVSKSLRIMGQDALKSIQPALMELNDFMSSPRFTVFSQQVGTIMAGTFDGLTASAKSTWAYLDSHYFSNPQFGQLPDISSKVGFIFSDLSAEFSKWYADTGSKQVSAATTQITTTILDGLNNAAPDIGQAAVNIGGKIAVGILDGLNRMGSPLDRLEESLGITSTRQKYIAIQEKLSGRTTTPAPTFYGPPAPMKTDGSHYNGIDYVPRDGYNARLHKGETVLTRQEAEEHRNGSGGKGGVTIAKLADQIIVREEADIDLFARRLAREIMALH